MILFAQPLWFKAMQMYYCFPSEGWASPLLGDSLSHHRVFQPLRKHFASGSTSVTSMYLSIYFDLGN